MKETLRELLAKLVPFGNGTQTAPPVPQAIQYPIAPKHLTLEVSYKCNLECMMCPRRFDGVPQDFFPPALFAKLVPDLSRYESVHLTGYGEPLMSPHFIDFLKAVVAAGPKAFVTTNGLLLKGNLARHIIEEGITHVTVSIDAGYPETYEKVRGKGTFIHATKCLRDFAALRREIRPDVFVEWSFILMRSTFRELPLALQMAIDMGLNRFTAKHLECVLAPAEFSEALFATGYVDPPEMEVIEELESVLEECRRIAEGKIHFYVHPYQFQINGHCLVQPTIYHFIDYEGNLSNCCYLNRLNTRPYHPTPEDNGLMGNIQTQSLDEILGTAKYVDFQKDWMEGRVPPSCEGCVNLARMGPQPYPPARKPAAVGA